MILRPDVHANALLDQCGQHLSLIGLAHALLALALGQSRCDDRATALTQVAAPFAQRLRNQEAIGFGQHIGWHEVFLLMVAKILSPAATPIDQPNVVFVLDDFEAPTINLRFVRPHERRQLQRSDRRRRGRRPWIFGWQVGVVG